MDIVLEICDYFIFDRLYAAALPKGGKVDQFIQNSPVIQQASSKISQFLPVSSASYDTLDNAILGNTTSPIYNALNFQFNATSVNVANLPSYLWTKVMNLQNKSEIYGLKPTFYLLVIISLVPYYPDQIF